MTRSKITRAAGATFIGIVAAMALSNSAAAEQRSHRLKNIVLVHGAWADGSSWSKVIPLLQAKGFHVVAVQNPLTSLEEDVRATTQTIALQDGPVLLVGHSYGGTVITEAGNDPKVAGLVYVAAYAPDQGQSTLDLALATPTPIGEQLIQDPYGFLRLTREGIFRDFAPDLSVVERRILNAAQAPIALQAFGAPVTAPAWKTKPCWFLIAAHDRAIAPQQQAAAARNMKAVTTTLPANHVALLSDPYEVAAFIGKAAATVGR